MTDLSAIATDDGTFAVVALDQRNTIRKMFAKLDHQASDADLVSLKTDIIAGLMGTASAFLIDPDFGLPAARAVPGGPPPTLLAVEPAEREKHGEEPVVALDPAQDAAWAQREGADAVKFFVQMRPDRRVDDSGRDLVAEALAATETLIADCRRVGIPAVVENLIYPLPGGEGDSPEARSEAIIGAAERLDALGPDLLKLEYPGSPEACRRLAERISSPWAVLSAGVPMSQFSEVLKISCDEGGASGFICGRAIWADSLVRPDRAAYLAETGRRRLEECRQVIDGRARPYQEVRS